jgi:MinD-like ATPase involved in chromosome partitioning or flagellar assembly
MTLLETKQRGRRAHLAVVSEDSYVKVATRTEDKFPVKVISCWGPSGSPGKSTIASNLACELALLGQRVLLLDLDTLAPSLAIALGLVDTPAGLSACLRLAEQDRLTIQEYQRLTVAIQLGRSELRFMPGLNSPARWPEVTAERVSKLLASVQSEIDLVVLDLPQATHFRTNLNHPSAMISSAETTRDSLLIDMLLSSSKLVMISGADPVSAHRFLAAQEYLNELSQNLNPYTIVNRFRTSALGSKARQELEETYLNLGKVRIDAFIPDEPENLDSALLNGLPLTLLKRSSPARQAISDLARQLLIDSASGDTLAKLS